MDQLLDDAGMAERILDHIDRQTTDLGEMCWREPVANYLSPARLEAEIAQVFRRTPTPFCPSAALARPGAYVARVPLLAVRGTDGRYAASGLPYDQSYVVFFEVKAGKLWRYREYWNPLVSIDAFGGREACTAAFGQPEAA